jgi:hypothetical protein
VYAKIGEVGVLFLGRGAIRLPLCLSVHLARDIARVQRVFLGHRQCWGMVRIGMGREEVDLVCWDLIQRNPGKDLGEYSRHGAAATPTACTSNTCPSDWGIQPIDGEVLQYGVILIIDKSSLDGLGRAPGR